MSAEKTRQKPTRWAILGITLLSMLFCGGLALRAGAWEEIETEEETESAPTPVPAQNEVNPEPTVIPTQAEPEKTAPVEASSPAPVTEEVVQVEAEGEKEEGAAQEEASPVEATTQSQAETTESPDETQAEASQEASVEISAPTPTMTPESAWVPTATHTPEWDDFTKEDGAVAAVVDSEAGSKVRRLDKKVGLNNKWDSVVINSGYLVASKSQVPRIGTVAESSKQDIHLVTGNRLVLRLSQNSGVKEGDQLVVYRFLDSYSDPMTGRSLGQFVKNLAVLKVARLDGALAQAIVTRCWHPFYKGEPIKSYENELARWKKSRHQRALPAEPIECGVAGPCPGREQALMNETIVLGAGEDQGVVAGMTFELRKPVEASPTKKTWMPIGKAKVFYVGNGYSMAKILWNQDPILRGFRAVYQP